MGTTPKLRAVPDAGLPAVPMSVTEAAGDGSQRDLLVAMRARVAQAVEDPKTMARDLAALTRRLMEIAREIEAIDSRAGGDDIGDAASTPDEEFSAEAL